jgi:cell wall-associated NlpC family hydrolase
MAYDPVTITGRVGYGTTLTVHDQGAALQRLTSAGWLTLGWARLNSAGVATFTAAPTSSTTYRVFYTGYLGFASSHSAAWTITVTPQTKAARVVSLAASRTGSWYEWGAAGPDRFDCSGLTLWAYRQVGVNLPHNADAQKWYGHAVSWAQARPGDLIIFVSGGYGYHAAIYAGGGYMYDAPHEGATVGKHKIWSSSILIRRLV